MRSDAAGRIQVAAEWVHFAAGRLYAAVERLTVCFNLTFFFCTAVNNIHLVLYGDLHVQQALALVAASEVYSEVGDNDQPQVLQAAAPSPVLKAAIIKPKDRHVEGEVPPHFPEQAPYSSHASTSLCLENQEQYTRLAHYMYS